VPARSRRARSKARILLMDRTGVLLADFTETLIGPIFFRIMSGGERASGRELSWLFVRWRG